MLVNASEAEPLVLALDTSSAVTSLALATPAGVVASRSIRHDGPRSEALWTDIRSMLDQQETSLEDIDLFAVCLGPGGFTGLRVGIAAIEGLSFATGKPAAGVTSLEAAAFGARRQGSASAISTASGSERDSHDASLQDAPLATARGADTLATAQSIAMVCALVSAYKGEVYSQLFEFDELGVPVARNEPLVSPSGEAIARVADLERIVFAGDAVDACREVITANERFGESWSIATLASSVAENVASLALLTRDRWGQGLKACYVRPAEAEVKLARGLLGSKIRRTLSR